MKELNFGIKAIAAELDRHGFTIKNLNSDSFQVEVKETAYEVGYNLGGGFFVKKLFGSKEPVRVYNDMDVVAYYLISLAQ